MFRKLLPLLSLVCLCAHAQAQELVNDRQIKIKSPADILTMRAALIEHVWGSDGFPAGKLPRLPVIKNDENPVPDLADLERVDTLIVDMEAGLKSYAHHFIPRVKNNRLVILHAGHLSSFDDTDIPSDAEYGMRRTIKGLLGDGYSVLAVYMPRNVEFDTTITVSDDGGYEAHNELFSNEKYRPAKGTPLKYFLEPIAAYLNYLTSRSAVDNFPVYQDLSIVGLSGGGWAATIYPAIDTRIKVSIAVAGSMPLYLRSGLGVGDAEQTVSEFYSIAGYPDLYVMASAGTGRKHVQILNRSDWCCFSEVTYNPELAGGVPFDDAVREYESKVREKLISLGNKELFSVEIDEVAPGHNITWDAIFDTILPELNESRRHIATASGSDAVARGSGGNPAVFVNGIWGPSKMPQMTGVPALIRGATGIHDMFFRDSRNRLVHVSRPPMTWSRPRVLLEKAISDPAAVSRGPGSFDVVALGTDYLLYHIRRSGAETTVERVSEFVKGVGQPTLIATGPERLDLFYKSWNRKLYHARKVGSSPWLIEEVGGRMIDLPTAVRLNDGSFRVYVRGTGGGLFEARRAADDGSLWSDWVSVTEHLQTGPILGSPSSVLVGNTVNVYARTPDAKIRKFTFNGSWTFSDQAGAYAGSPTASVQGVFARSAGGTLTLANGPQIIELGGPVD
jgi:hypothetical protein